MTSNTVISNAHRGAIIIQGNPINSDKPHKRPFGGYGTICGNPGENAAATMPNIVGYVVRPRIARHIAMMMHAPIKPAIK